MSEERAAPEAGSEPAAEVEALNAFADDDAGAGPGPGTGGEVADISADDVQREIAEVRDRYLRLAADFDNYRKRAKRERAELQATAAEAVVVELLPVLDNLERALAAATDGKEGRQGFESVLKGVELTLRMFHSVLAKFGVERMDAAGEPFDPHRHEALSQDESAEVVADTVGEVFEPGYSIRGKVVRPARVKVLRPKAASPAMEEG